MVSAWKKIYGISLISIRGNYSLTNFQKCKNLNTVFPGIVSSLEFFPHPRVRKLFKFLLHKRKLNAETIWDFQGFKNSKKNSFPGNYLRKYGSFPHFIYWICKKKGKLFKEIRYLGTCKATHQSCKCRPSVDWFLALFQRYPFEVPAAASQNYLKIVQIWIDVKKQLTISHIGPFINHPKYFFAWLIKNGETSHPLKN